VLALIEAAGLICADAAFQSTLGEFPLEELLQPGFGGRIATSAGMARRALVSADEDVSFEFRHENALLAIDQGVFLILIAAAIMQKWRALSLLRIGFRNL
jgi:hypothetical protein